MRLRSVLVVLAATFAAAASVLAQDASVIRASGPPGTITTIAGNGTAGFSGDGGSAINAELSNPNGVAFDNAGDLYIADFGNCRVRKVSGGTITTIAGSSACGFFGDGGIATSARLSNIYGVALDNAGNLYIADYGNCRVREVTGGTITTIAGTGLCGFAGDGGAAISASLNAPYSVALDGSGNLYIADAGNCRVREVSGGTIATVAGGGGCGFSGDSGPATSAALNVPTGVALDGVGNLFIADVYNCRVRKVSGGIITTAAGIGTGVVPDGCGYSGDGGPATGAALYYPTGVALDGASNLYIADSQNCRVRKVSAGVINAVAGSGTCGYSGDGGVATSAALSVPLGVTIDVAGNMYIADQANDRVREVFSAPPSVGGVAQEAPLASLSQSRSARIGAVAAWSAIIGGLIASALVAFMLRRRLAH